jgi:hypothetical protein
MAACPQTESRTETISYTEFLTDPGSGYPWRILVVDANRMGVFLAV